MENNNKNNINGVFIAARKIINNGKITSEGKDVSTEVITDHYEGTGEVSAKNILPKKWYTTSWGIFIELITVAGVVYTVLSFYKT